jgi:hypothetical protein
MALVRTGESLYCYVTRSAEFFSMNLLKVMFRITAKAPRAFLQY